MMTKLPSSTVVCTGLALGGILIALASGNEFLGLLSGLFFGFYGTQLLLREWII